MIFNSQGAAELKQFINGGSITPGEEVTLPKGAQLLGDLTIEAVTAGPLEVTPSSEQQIFTPAAGEYYNRVTVEAAESSEGLYGWEKCDYKTKTVNLQFTWASSTTIKITSNDVDLSLVDDTFFVGFTGTWYNGSGKFSILANNVFNYVSGSFTYTYNPSTQVMTLSGVLSSSTFKYTVNPAEKEVLSAIGYAVSDNPSEYPTSGMYDGYFYKRLN